MGDGCNMEGMSNEAASLAGHWGLGRLIVFYDDNRISIDGNTDISFTEDVSARHVALGWHVQHVVVSRFSSAKTWRTSVQTPPRHMLHSAPWSPVDRFAATLGIRMFAAFHIVDFACGWFA